MQVQALDVAEADVLVWCDLLPRRKPENGVFEGCGERPSQLCYEYKRMSERRCRLRDVSCIFASPFCGSLIAVTNRPCLVGSITRDGRWLAVQRTGRETSRLEIGLGGSEAGCLSVQRFPLSQVQVNAAREGKRFR